MTSTTASSPNCRQAPFVRLLAFALVVLITYGATVEATHAHGAARLPTHDFSTTHVNALSASSSGLLKASFSGSDCLICQLHQQLSSGLFTALPSIAAPAALTATLSTTPLTASSQINASPRGRAPPTISF